MLRVTQKYWGRVAVSPKVSTLIIPIGAATFGGPIRGQGLLHQSELRDFYRRRRLGAPIRGHGLLRQSEPTNFSTNPSSGTFTVVGGRGANPSSGSFLWGGISGSPTSQSCASRHSWRNTPPETDGLPSRKGSNTQRHHGEVHMTDDSCFCLHILAAF